MVVGFSQRQFFSAAEFDEKFNPCPYQLAKFMAACQVKLIDQHICFTDVQPPAFVDKFWEICQMFCAWVENMRYFFIASWCTLVGNVADMSPRVVATPTMSSKNWPT